LITTWGIMGGKPQISEKICVGLNIGKSNETTPETQAKLEMKAKITLLKKEGYSTKKPELDKLTIVKLDLDNLPIEFCPSKPIGQEQCPQNVLDDEDTYGQRKHDGHCLILTHGKKTKKVYTRRMEDITKSVAHIPEIAAKLQAIPKGAMITYEFVFYDNKFKKEIAEIAGGVIRTDDPIEVTEKYEKFKKLGKFSMIPLDQLFKSHEFIGDTKTHLLRYKELQKADATTPELYFNWKTTALKIAKKENWEGLILRTQDERSYVSYSMDGKAHKTGGWKHKFYKEGDFFVDEVLMGKSGKHANFYAKFHLAQYDENGNYIDRGYTGCGELTHNRLAELNLFVNITWICIFVKTSNHA